MPLLFTCAHRKPSAVEAGDVLKNARNVKTKSTASYCSGRSSPSNKSSPVSAPIPLQDTASETGDCTGQTAVIQHTSERAPFLASPQCSIMVLVASDAKRHLELNMHALECILVDFGVRRDLWIFQVGFDEELLCGGVGYIQEVLITILEDLEIVGGDSMIEKIGRIVSPFPGVVRMPGYFFRTPVFKRDGTAWRTYDDFIREHVKTLDSFEYDSARGLYMARSCEVKEPPVDQEKEKESSKAESNSTASTSTSGSARTTGGGNHSKKERGKAKERTEQEDPSDSSDDSHDPDPHAGTSRTRPRIQFEIITKIMGQAQRETLKIAGAFTFKVGCSSFCSIISMSLIPVSFLCVIGAAKIRGKPLSHIECRVLEC